ncbi:endolytic transglycosylase MltG [Candidatus Daviesbacteria bacterium]|nr:endolytic transglycosylase MltG [Candidatus Daviesbacteria bacterium]
MKKVFGLIVLLIILGILAKGFWSSQLGPVGTSKESKDIVISKGQSLSQIADQLKKSGIIKSSWMFQMYVRQKGLGNKLQAGLFKVSPSMDSSEIIKVLTQGPEGIWVRLIEGWRVEEMAEEVEKQLNVDKKEFLKLAKEGYMFPDSYLFPRQASAEYVVSTLKNTFDQKFTKDLRSKIKAQGLTLDQGVILASIVEREGRSQEVRRMVASILLKRFKIEMGLNADATVQYILGYQEDENPPAGGWWKRHLTRDDLKVASPFNTYIHSGLPPKPIANPSLSSLQAVAEADSSTLYLYYYHDSKGNSHYGKTLEEHNANIANNP